MLWALIGNLAHDAPNEQRATIVLIDNWISLLENITLLHANNKGTDAQSDQRLCFSLTAKNNI